MGHVLGRDAVVVDTDTIGVGVQWSETSNTDDFAKNLIRASPAFAHSVASRHATRYRAFASSEWERINAGPATSYIGDDNLMHEHAEARQSL